jgi:hypothetical protein
VALVEDRWKVIAPDGDELEILQYGESPISVIDRRLVFRRGP